MLKDRKKLIFGVIMLVIVVGLIITATKGLKYDLVYAKNESMYINMKSEVSAYEIKSIMKEIFGKEKIYVQESKLTDNVIAITAKKISDEKQNEIIEKLSQKYEVEINKEHDTDITKNSKIRGRDIVMPYMYSIVVSAVAILVCIAIKHRKKGALKRTGYTLLMIVLAQALYLSILAIVRIPVNTLTMPISLLIFATTPIITETKFKK